MTKSARQYVFEGMELLPGALEPFVEKRLESGFGEDWRKQVRQRHSTALRMARQNQDTQAVQRLPDSRLFENFAWDQVALLKVMDWLWMAAFSTELTRGDRDAVQQLISVRTKLAHKGTFTYDTADDALKYMHRLVQAVDANEASKKAAAQIRAMRTAIPCKSETVFNGLPFGDVAFGHAEGKKVLRLAMEKLREHPDLLCEIGIDPNHRGKNERNIRNDGGVVWNVLVFKAAGDWQKFPHLTLGVGNEYVSAMATLPTKAPTGYWERLAKHGNQDFRRIVKDVLAEMHLMLRKYDGMEPRLRVRQRRQSSDKDNKKRTLMDAYIDVDLRACIDDVKPQLQWIDAVFDAVKNKRSKSDTTNLELQIGAKFPYRSYIAGPDALDRVAKSWIACKPYIAALFGLEYIQGQPLNFSTPFD